MQPVVERLMELGPLPSVADPDVDKLKEIQNLLKQIEQPISDEEARTLVMLFGPDDCFGLAWTLLHIIETAPGWPLHEVLDEIGNEWTDQLKARAAK